MHRAILTLLDEGRRPLPCRLRLVRSIGAPLAPDLIAALEKALQAPVIEGYGMTEAGAVTGNPLPPGRRKPGSVGIMTGAEVGIFDASGRRLRGGEEGEIRLRGPGITRGYWNDPEANRTSFADGWLCTGDLGRFDEDGYLYVTGRVKELVNRGGEKIRPVEVDAVLAAHPSVADAAAFGVPHPTLGEDIAAAVVRRAGQQVSENELRAYAAEYLAGFKIPRHILFLDQIPKGATGKAQRAALRDQYSTRLQQATLDGATDLESKITDVWNRILHIDVGLDDDFFAAGGDSLAATIMLAEVRAVLAVDPALLERVDFFENPTVRSLARIVAECGVTGDQPESALLALEPNGYRPPLFLLPDATSEPYYFRSLAKHLGKDQPVLVLRYSSSDGPTGVRTVEQVAARCLKVVRSVQPRGPYRISGHCFGGMVAFEMARQVIAAGEQVALLALLDTTTPGYPDPHKHWRGYAQAVKEAFSREQGRALARQALAHVRYLVVRARLVGGARWRRRLVASSVAAVLPVPLTNTGANETAGRVYVPQPTPVRAVQFVAADEPTETKILADPRLKWKQFALAGFEVRRTPGDHLSMFAEPHVQTLAAELRAELSRNGSAVSRAFVAAK
jgi:thioesterase domain-containing protein